jgi:hypothetical protein
VFLGRGGLACLTFPEALRKSGNHENYQLSNKLSTGQAVRETQADFNTIAVNFRTMIKTKQKRSFREAYGNTTIFHCL